MPEIPTLPVLNLPHDNDSFLLTYEFTFNIKSKVTSSFILSSTYFQAPFKLSIVFISLALTFGTFTPSKTSETSLIVTSSTSILQTI